MKYIYLIILVSTLSANLYGQTITTYAGNGSSGSSGSSGDGGSATSATISLPCNSIFDNDGNLIFVGGISNSRIRSIDIYGIIYTIGGGAVDGFSGDGGPATSAALFHPYGIAVDRDGNKYIADYENFRIRKIETGTGIISTVAGNGTAGSTGDGGPATLASIVPYGVCVDRMNNIYVIDGYGTKVRKIDPTGLISTIAGNGIGGYSGDGGPATSAAITINYGICVDTSGNIFLACNTRIRKINLSTNIITTIAGNGLSTYIGDRIPALSASFNAFTIGIDSRKNNIYTCDIVNDRVYKIDQSGFFQLIAGTGTEGYSGDGGNATAAQLYNPQGIATDLCGNIYISDAENKRIRKITLDTPTYTIPTISIAGSTSAALGSSVALTASIGSAGSSYTIHWLNRGVEFTTTTIPSVTYTKLPGNDTITARVISTATYGCYDSSTSLPHIVTISGTGLGSSFAGDDNISIYPNPAGEVLNISGTKIINLVTITNLIGQVVYSSPPTNSAETINIAALPAGVFVLQLSCTNGEKIIRKFVKE